jgi:hypothetical protein
MCVVIKFLKNNYQSEKQQEGQKKYVYVPPILAKSGKTLPELLKLDHIEDVYWLSSRASRDYSRSLVYVTKEQETKIAEAAIKELIDNSDSIMLYISKDYVTFDKFTVDDKIFLHLLSENFALKSNIEIWPVGGPNLLMSEYITFQPSGLSMVGSSVHDSCNPPQWGKLKIDLKFFLLYDYYFEDLLIAYAVKDNPRTKPIYQGLINKNKSLEETFEKFKREITPYHYESPKDVPSSENIDSNS